MKEQRFKKMQIWIKAMSFIEEIYLLTKDFPVDERFGLVSQIRRASTSIALNIAEGSGADSDRDFNRFLGMSLKSAYEVMCGIEIAKRLKFGSNNGLESLKHNCDEIIAMITGFKKSLR